MLLAIIFFIIRALHKKNTQTFISYNSILVLIFFGNVILSHSARVKALCCSASGQQIEEVLYQF